MLYKMVDYFFCRIEMNFAVNNHSPELLTKIVSALDETICAASSLTQYALIDTAFDPNLVAKYKRHIPDIQIYEFYAGTGLDQLKEISPCLIVLPNDDSQRIKAIKTLLLFADGKPMLSFLVSDLAGEQLVLHLQSILEVETSDGQHLVLRFADTRVISVLIKVLDQSQRQSIFAPIINWWLIGRAGKLECLDWKKDKVLDSKYSISSKPFSRLLLSDEQFEFLLDAAESDAIIEQLWKIVPEHCVRIAGAALHEFIARQLTIATSFLIEGALDRIAYCVGALNTQGKLHEIDLVRVLLERKNWQPGGLADALAELPETCWA